VARQSAIVNISGDYEETLTQKAKHLGKNQVRRDVFLAIYGRARKPQSLNQILDRAGLDAGRSQQVRNALDHLSKHNLISKEKNGDRKKDSGHFVYGKLEDVRANKDKIIDFADNPRKADKVPTKRRPAVVKQTTVRRITKRALSKQKDLSILYLTADAQSQSETDVVVPRFIDKCMSADPAIRNDLVVELHSLVSKLRLDAEMRKVQEEIRGSKFSDKVNIEYRPAADYETLVKGLNDIMPQVVHYSGHSNTYGLAFDDGSVETPETNMLSYSLLSKALGAPDNPPRILLLNSCESSAGRDELLKSVDVLISMKVSVSDIAAATFAPFFYAAIASGQSVQSAFEQGKNAVESVSIGEAYTPEIFSRDGINLRKLILT